VGKLRAVVGMAAVAGLAAACSSTATLVDHPAGSSKAAHVGDTLSLKTQAGKTFDMTLESVTDPAHTTSGAAAPGAKRYIAVMWHITDTSGSGISGNTNADANLVGSNGNAYLPAHVTLMECSGHGPKFNPTPGKTVTACTAFEVRTAIKITQVQFSPAAGAAADYGQWLVP